MAGLFSFRDLREPPEEPTSASLYLANLQAYNPPHDGTLGDHIPNYRPGALKLVSPGKKRLHLRAALSFPDLRL